jgi:predicted phage-related endonuclease
MSTCELETKITKMQEYEALAVEAKAEAVALRDEIKAELTRRNAEEVTTGKYIVRWTSVLSQRFDSTAFKRAMPDVYRAFTKQVSSRRFSVSA